MFRRIDERMLVAGQISPSDVAVAAAAGVTMIVNNRPDGEQPGQPTGAEIEAAAGEHGIKYRSIPVRGGIAPEQVAAMLEALTASEGTVLAYCAAGTRSSWLWAFARAQAGDEAEEIIRKAALAGYDLTPLRDYL
jgi:uncharacterized protein (TIGR01244 family)